LAPIPTQLFPSRQKVFTGILQQNPNFWLVPGGDLTGRIVYLPQQGVNRHIATKSELLGPEWLVASVAIATKSETLPQNPNIRAFQPCPTSLLLFKRKGNGFPGPLLKQNPNFQGSQDLLFCCQQDLYCNKIRSFRFACRA
jgi:hypothetical protein